MPRMHEAGPPCMRNARVPYTQFSVGPTLSHNENQSPQHMTKMQNHLVFHQSLKAQGWYPLVAMASLELSALSRTVEECNMNYSVLPQKLWCTAAGTAVYCRKKLSSANLSLNAKPQLHPRHDRATQNR